MSFGQALVIFSQTPPFFTIATPSGWTQAYQGEFLDSTLAKYSRAALFWKRAAGTEDGTTVTVTHNGTTGSGTVFYGQVWRIYNCYTSGNWYDDVQAWVTGDGNTTISAAAATINASAAINARRISARRPRCPAAPTNTAMPQRVNGPHLYHRKHCLLRLHMRTSPLLAPVLWLQWRMR
jgi:hypothetical protein